MMLSACCIPQPAFLFCRERTKRSSGSDRVTISKAELDRMRDQLSALPALTQQLEVMTQQHKQLIELLVDKQQQQQQG